MSSRAIRELAIKSYRLMPEKFKDKVAALYIEHRKWKLGSQRSPTVIVFFITSRCNLRCSHCFYWHELNSQQDELSLSEIEKMASSLLSPIHLSITGGEPFLRQDIVEICSIFNKVNGCRNIGIATNGFKSERIASTCSTILNTIPLDSLSVQVSIDGLQSTHDAIRGLSGAYDWALKTIQELAILSKTSERFTVAASITVQKRNVKEIADLIGQLLPFQIPIRFALVRGQDFGTYGLPKTLSSECNPRETDSPVVDLERLTELFRKIDAMNISSSYQFWSKRQQKKIELSLQMMKTRKKQLPCYAGKLDGVIYANGEMALCELSKPIGNIRDHHYNIASLWSSKESQNVRQGIRNCFCIHGCNLATSMMFDPEILKSVLDQE
ncbi:MAG: radical SAM/SPASM domain-containing protein [Anaerolineaceae bacterium]